MNWFWIIVITVSSVIGGTSFCFYLLHKTREVESTQWILEHIICPIIRILVLVTIVSQIYPAVSINVDSFDFWRILFEQKNINHAINILFLASLALAFLPVVNHPIFVLPIQSCLTIALVFNWQFVTLAEAAIAFIPDLTTTAKIIIYTAVSYFITREVSIRISHWLDKLLTISGSIQLVSDAIYLVLQIPVMLIYCQSLKSQIALELS